jgi:hypothetical protein
MGNPTVASSIDWGNVAQWAGALCTLSAVIVALTKEEIIRIWRRPKLVGTIKLAPPDSIKTNWTYYPYPQEPLRPEKADCYYFRLWISNEGNARAEKVQVFTAKISKRSVDGTFRPVGEFLPMNLRWANTHEIFAEAISPGMGKHCDLGHMTHPNALVLLQENHPDVPPGKTVLALDTEVKPNTKNHLVPPGTYRLELRIAGANCSPVATTVEITVTGDWCDEQAKMFCDQIGIKLLGGEAP